MKIILAAGIVVVPLLYSRGLDVFNLPKELAFRAEAILLVAAAVFWAAGFVAGGGDDDPAHADRTRRRRTAGSTTCGTRIA